MATPISTFFLRLLVYASLLSLETGLAVERTGSSESRHVESTHLNVQITSLMPSSVCRPSPKGHDERASLEVVHKHGPCSKLKHHKDKSPSHTHILAQDKSRVASIQSKLGKNLAGGSPLKGSKSTLPTKSAITLGSGNYIVTVGLGSPKKDLTLIFDTGSDLTWTQCQPCVRYCYKQKDLIFDPSKSSSVRNERSL